MSEKLSNLEFQSTLELKSLLGDILESLSEHFSGDITVNQLRIGHYIGLKSLYLKEPTNNKDISDQLGIPRSTVSRIVGDYLEKGWVVKQKDTDDGRKYILAIPTQHPLSDHFEKEFRRRINELLLQYKKRKVTVVDTKKNGY